MLQDSTPSCYSTIYKVKADVTKKQESLYALAKKSVDNYRLNKLKSHGLPVKIVLAQNTLTKGGSTMTQQQYIINRKLNILELGEILGNISDACRRLDISRQHFYDIRTAVAEEGIEGLVEKSRQSPRMGNRAAPWIEEALLDYSLEFPTHGQFRAANELKKRGVPISPGGVRSVWLRHSLNVRAMRLKRLEEWAAVNEHPSVPI